MTVVPLVPEVRIGELLGVSEIKRPLARAKKPLQTPIFGKLCGPRGDAAGMGSRILGRVEPNGLLTSLKMESWPPNIETARELDILIQNSPSLKRRIVQKQGKSRVVERSHIPIRAILYFAAVYDETNLDVVCEGEAPARGPRLANYEHTSGGSLVGADLRCQRATLNEA